MSTHMWRKIHLIESTDPEARLMGELQFLTRGVSVSMSHFSKKGGWGQQWSSWSSRGELSVD